MADDPEVTPLPNGGPARRALGVRLSKVLGFDPRDEATREMWVAYVLTQAHERGVPAEVIVAELGEQQRRLHWAINSGVVDRFTILHFAAGLGLGAAGMTSSQAMTLGSFFELGERVAKERRPDLFPHPSQDSAANSAADIAAIGLGAWLTFLED